LSNSVPSVKLFRALFCPLPGTRLSAKSSPAVLPDRFMIVPFGFGLPRYQAQSWIGIHFATKDAGSPRPPSRLGTGPPLTRNRCVHSCWFTRRPHFAASGKARR
jgi:hypothetical protein